MFTVLIAEKEHIDAIQQNNKLFFEPFLTNRELAFCYWNPQGQNLSDSVPGLMDAVGRRKEWRVVIINSSSGSQIKNRNPFDVVNGSVVENLNKPEERPEFDVNVDEWEKNWKEYFDAKTNVKKSLYEEAIALPLQKLTTWLCFKPKDFILNDVKEKNDVHDWALEELNRDTLKTGTRLEILERNQYKIELRNKEMIRRNFIGNFCLNIAYPSELQCISIRTADDNFFNPENYWSVWQESDYSTFADRNMYFDKMRFVVFDLLPKEHKDFRTDYIRFLASVLIFASNPVPGSAMQARHLYSLEVNSDDTPLCTLITSYDKKLLKTLKVIDTEMEKIKGDIPSDLSDKTAEKLFCTQKDVAVLLDDSCETDKVLVDNNYGLFTDFPENEFHKWNRDFSYSKKAMIYILKQQEKAVKKCVDQQRLFSEISDVNISRLTFVQLEDIRAYTNEMENEMVRATPPDFSNESYYIDRLIYKADAVRKFIKRRMTVKTTFILGIISLVLFFICFLPFVFSNHNNAKTFVTAINLSAIMVGILAVIMVVSLFVLRLSIKKAVRDYNNTARSILAEIHSSLKDFSKYMSASYNVKRGHYILQYAEKNLDDYTKSLHIRKKHREDIRKKRACLVEEYKDYLADSSMCDEIMSRPYDYDFDRQVEYEYPAPFLAGDCRQIEFICKGNYVTVPFSFVKSMIVKLEGIYEK